MSATKHCRFCAELKPTLELMDFENDVQLREQIYQKLLHFSINCVDFSNNLLPEAVCLQCYASLNSAYEFFNKIKTAQELLQELHLNVDVKIEKCFLSEDSIDNYDSNVYIKYENPPCDTNISLEISFEDSNTCSKPDLGFPLCETDCDKSDSLNLNWHSYSWSCKLCSEIFTDLVSLRNHSKALHSICNSFKCTDCGKECTIFHDFIEHIRSHRDDLKNFCPYCNIKLEDKDNLHIELHTSKPNCHLCGETYHHESEKQMHFEQYFKSKKASDKGTQESWSAYSWICKFCCILLPNENMLRMHTKEMHKKCFGMQCIDCKISVHNFSTFVAHVRSHRPYLKHFCQYCDHMFNDSQDTVIHLAKHFDGQFQCEDCSEIFSSRDDLQGHIKLYRSPRPEERSRKTRHQRRFRPITTEDLTCEVCHKAMKTLNGLYKHRQLHKQRSRDYTCDRCGKAFFSKACLTSHILIHENNTPQVCQICKKTFLTLTRLKKHVLTHSGDKPFQCSECHRRFRLKEQLKGHQITHTDLLPYPCQYCDKAFRHKNVRRIHENQHTGARAYPCNVCDKVLSNWSNCNKHMKRKHGTTLAKNILTPQGRLPINPKTGKPKKINMENVKEWTEKIMAPVNKRGEK